MSSITAWPTPRALDVGCGEGADAVWLAQHGWTVTAVDVVAEPRVDPPPGSPHLSDVVLRARRR